MTKICTDLQQSKRLIEVGIDITTADMYYPNRTDMKFQGALPIEYKHGNSLLSQEIPAWSLSALLELLPETICFEDNENDYAIEILIENGLYYLSYGNPLEHDVINVEPQACFIDVCVDMIVKLHEKEIL